MRIIRVKKKPAAETRNQLSPNQIKTRYYQTNILASAGEGVLTYRV